MGDRFYKVICAICRPVFWASSRPTTIGVNCVPRDGACIIASTHQSPYDVPLLIRHTPRVLDFVSITEVFRQPLVGWLYRNMNAFPLDRSRPDPKTVRVMLDRLEHGRVVVMFPEGGFRRGAASVVHARKIKPGVGRIARLAGVPIVPCVVFNSLVYGRFFSWFPLGRSRYGVAYGKPLLPGADETQDPVTEAKLVDALVELHQAIWQATGMKDLNAPVESVTAAS